MKACVEMSNEELVAALVKKIGKTPLSWEIAHRLGVTSQPLRKGDTKKKFTVYMWNDDGFPEGEYLEGVEAASIKEAEEKASLECPNFEHYQVVEPF